ncbi:Ig-like domain-containing protein [Planctomycetota bacterium]
MYRRALQKLLEELAAYKGRVDFRNNLVFSAYLHFSIVALFILAICLLDIIAAVRIPVPGLGFVLLMYASALVISLVVTHLRSRLEKPTCDMIARELEAKFDLKDRLLTSTELMSSPVENPMEEVLAADALKFTREALDESGYELFRRHKVLRPWIHLIIFSTAIWLFPMVTKRILRRIFDHNPPTISKIFPQPGSLGISTDKPTTIAMEFSEEMDPTTVTEQNISLYLANGLEPVAVKMRLEGDNRTVIVETRKALKENSLYGIFLSNRLRDLGGNVLHAFGDGGTGESWVSTFRTKDPARLARPFYLIETSPARGETDVALDRTVLIEFSKQVSAASANKSVFHLRKHGENEDVDSLIHPVHSDYIIELEPFEHLEADTLYSIIIESDVESISRAERAKFDPYGWRNMDKPYTVSFRTAMVGRSGDIDDGGRDGQNGNDNGPPVRKELANPQPLPNVTPKPDIKTRPKIFSPPDGDSPIEQSSLPGEDTDDNLFTDPTDPQFQTRDEMVDPLMDQDAEFHRRIERFRYNEDSGAGSGRGDGSDGELTGRKDYEALFEKYMQLHLDNLKQSTIPPVYRELVKKYFRSIHPESGK